MLNALDLLHEAPWQQWRVLISGYRHSDVHEISGAASGADRSDMSPTY